MLVHHVALLCGGLFSCAVGNDLADGDFSVGRCAAQPLIMVLYTNEFNSLFMLNRVRTHDPNVVRSDGTDCFSSSPPSR